MTNHDHRSTQRARLHRPTADTAIVTFTNQPTHATREHRQAA